MYTIGLIDDELSEIKKIRRTIKQNASILETEYAFKSYDIPTTSDEVVDLLFSDVLRDIENSRISALIIDYKIIVSTIKIKGTDIFKKVKDRVVQFPVIILTEVVAESILPDFVDADKVYEKRFFFRLQDDYSKEKVEHIFDSMKKYVAQKDEITVKLDLLKDKLSDGDRNAIKEILELEKKLDAFIPVNQTQFDMVFNEGKVTEIMRMLNEINGMLG
ncbi:MAG: hypothetical protein VZQ98_14410 [Bacteroidales bacterium]|nr:hypothetical protein [Bacteroidales bacterium]